MAPVWRSAISGLVASWLGGFAAIGVLILRERAAGFGVFDVGAFRWSPTANIAWSILGLVLWLALFAGLHLLLARLGSQRLVSRLSVVVGCLGGLITSVPIARPGGYAVADDARPHYESVIPRWARGGAGLPHGADLRSMPRRIA